MKLKYIIPFVILFGLTLLLARELYYSQGPTLASTLIGQPLPQFNLSDITRPQIQFSNKNLPQDQVSLLHVWATWCEACNKEHSMMMEIKNQYQVPIYSIVYKDDAKQVKQWLANAGNPYILSGNDATGDVAIDLGVYGTPETFVISKNGLVLYRHVGIISQEDWDEVIYPIIKQG